MGLIVGPYFRGDLKVKPKIRGNVATVQRDVRENAERVYGAIPKRLLGYWPFWDLAGTRVSDIINGRNAVTGNPTWSNKGLVFDGTWDYIDTGQSFYPSTGKLTIAHKTSCDSTAVRCVAGNWPNGTTIASWLILYNRMAAGQLRIYIHEDGSNNFPYAEITGLSTSREYHCVWQWDANGTGNAGKVKLWLDGVQQTLSFSRTFTSMANTGFNVHIGRQENATSRDFSGEMQSLLLYDGILKDPSLLYEKEWGLLAPVPRRTYFVPAAGGGTLATSLLDGKVIIRTASSVLLDGLAVIKSSASDLLDGKATITTASTDLLDGKAVVKDVATAVFDGKATVRDVASDLLDGKTIVANTAMDLLDGKGVVKSSTTDLLDGKGIVKSATTDTLDGKGIISDTATDLLDGKGVVRSTATDTLDGKGIIKTDATDLLDGKSIISSAATDSLDGKVIVNAEGFGNDLLDGKTVIRSVATNHLDGLIYIGSVAENTLDGKTIIKSSATLTLDGKATIKDIVADLLDGSITIQTSVANVVDGKVVISSADVGLLNGKAIIQDDSTILLDGKVFISAGTQTDVLDGKVILSVPIVGKVSVTFSMKTPSVTFSMKTPSTTFTIT